MTLLFTMPDKCKKKSKTTRQYGNPMSQALRWQKELSDNKGMRRIDLAKKYKVTSARVSQVMNLLKLPQDIVDRVAALGDTFDTPLISSRKLESLLLLSLEQQRATLDQYLKATTK